MNGKKKIWLGTGIAFGAAALALGGYGLSFIGREPTYTDADYSEWVVTLAPTCEEYGVETRSLLSAPQITQERKIAPLGHEWGDWYLKTEPTCVTDGANERECSVCHNLDYQSMPALGHDWDEWVIQREPTCLVDGYDMRICKRDEAHTDLRTVAALGHEWSEWVVEVAPTCLTTGVEKTTCHNDKNHTQQRTVAALGHDWSPFVITKPATCTEDGARTRVCRNDSAHSNTYAITATGHSYGGWVTSIPATESEDGEEIRYCSHNSLHSQTRIAYATGSDNLTYTLNKAGTEYSVEGRGTPEPSGTVYIPAMHEGLPVTSIDSSGFYSCRDIEHIVFLGNNLKTINSSAFTGCTRLQSIEFPEGLTIIKAQIFRNCTSLKSISFPSTIAHMGMNYGDYGNYIGIITDVPMLESITVAEGNETYKVENGCLIEKETNTVLLGTKNAVIPKYVTYIGRGAFHGSGIESVCIPASTVSIGQNAFTNCKKLKDITFENGELKVLGGLMGATISGCESLERVVLPDSLMRIGRYAISNCASLREVVFGSNLQTIEGYAFEGCNNIEICEIPASVTKISATAFLGAVVSALTIAEGNETYFKEGNCIIERETNVLALGSDISVIPACVTAIGQFAFYRRNIESVIIPRGVQTIGGSAFYECASLKSVVFEMRSQLVKIDSDAFYKCTALTSIMLPEKLIDISSYAFYGCTALVGITFGYTDGILTYGASALETIGSYAFERTAIKSFEIPKTVTKIGSGVFSGGKLTSLTVKNGNDAYKMVNGCLFEIETGRVLIAFDGAVLPESTKIIDAYAFEYYKSEMVVIPAGVEEVKNYAFDGWTEEQTIVVKGFASEEEAKAVWGENWLSSWLGPCNATVVYERDDEAYYSATFTFNLCDNDTAYLVKARNKNLSGVIIIPATYNGLPVKEIIDNGFASINGITRVVIMGNNLQRIGNNAFAQCSALKSINIPEGVVNIGSNAFYGCAIKQITLPVSLTEIESNPFLNCSALETITVVSGNEAYRSESNCLIERKTNTLIAGVKNAVIPDSVTAIGECAFYGCTSASIEIPAGVTAVGNRAFRGWTEEQIIIVKGYASEEEADAAWGSAWRESCNATIIYAKEVSES